MTTASPSPGSGSGSGSGSIGGAVTSSSSAVTRAFSAAIAPSLTSTRSFRSAISCSSAVTRCSSCGSSEGLGIGVPVGENPPVVACYPQGEPPAMSMMTMPFTPEVRYAELTYEQKRAIRARLDWLYDWEHGRYIHGHSDHSIAHDLDIPWSLIRYVRERDYGHLAP